MILDDFSSPSSSSLSPSSSLLSPLPPLSLLPFPPPPLSLLPLPIFHRFLIDVKWLKQWKKYVGYDQWDQYHVGQVSANPGPIDNANLFKGTHSTMLGEVPS